ncbi:hypothetical protein MAPG_11506 [Magnaporthiopsis poae ATCC 64411]|uniref:Enoyl reductase (ER) domain-containing protein n=1 Tax=Magnaporthiopsis poae (strain ATCC 64411 / 73-15) TaxID=644358 RepID=A0A0C4EFG2_MAGP6|nr:hypothetical protein MAPG_11506 [Magnaporthiopsis poae ATCC 64411]
MAPVNKAAIIPQPRARPMRVDTVEYPTVQDKEIVVRVSAVAVNPVDWMIQDLGENLFPWLQYPLVTGCDVAGTVEHVGAGVTAGFKKGDRVLGLAAGLDSREGAFQDYVPIAANLAARIPDSLPFTDAAVLPLGLATAASQLYGPGALELALPAAGIAPNSRGETVVVWAGSSSVGSNAVQLAVASGYEVFTTASPRNFDFCKSLGASQVFDYASPNAAADIATALHGKRLAGVAAIYESSIAPIYEMLTTAGVAGSKRVAAAMPLGDKPVPEGVTVKAVFGGTIKDNHVAAAVFNEFLPKALAEGSYLTRPSPLVVGNGLETLQDALNKCKNDKISAQKLVVTLE